MHEALAESLSFPTVVFTVMLGIAAGYWLLVIVGALGLDMLDADAGDGGDGGHGDGDHNHPTSDAGLLGSLLGSLHLDTVPTTIVVSLIAFWGWIVSHFSGHFVAWAHSSWFTEIIQLVLAFIVAVLLTSIAVRPLAPFFRTHPAARRSALVGKVVTIDTSRVDAQFGLARAEDGGAGLIVQVRCDVDNHLGRGHRALVVSYDEVREVYDVAPLGDILPGDVPDLSKNPSGSRS